MFGVQPHASLRSAAVAMPAKRLLARHARNMGCDDRKRTPDLQRELLCIDGCKPGRPYCRQRVAAAAASVAEEADRGIERVLQRVQPLPLGRHNMLQKHKAAAGFEHPPRFRKRLPLVAHGAQHLQRVQEGSRCGQQ